MPQVLHINGAEHQVDGPPDQKLLYVLRDALENQISGAISTGLGGALFEATHFADGRILNPHLAEYRVPRFSDMPKIEVVVLDRKDLPPAGAGETPIMGIAPAISNAIFAATGVRLRSLPLVPEGLPKAGGVG